MWIREYTLSCVVLSDVMETWSKVRLPTTPRMLVCSSDPSTKPGQHWIAIYVDENGHGEYFDTYGRQPNEHLLVRNVINKG
jgi:hypothetical protein